MVRTKLTISVKAANIQRTTLKDLQKAQTIVQGHFFKITSLGPWKQNIKKREVAHDFCTILRTETRLTWASLRHNFQGVDHNSVKQDQKRDGSFHFFFYQSYKERKACVITTYWGKLWTCWNHPRKIKDNDFGRRCFLKKKRTGPEPIITEFLSALRSVGEKSASLCANFVYLLLLYLY